MTFGTTLETGDRVGMLAGLVLVLAIARYGYWSVAQSRFTVVTAHQLYQSGQMAPDKLLSVSKKHGIRTVIEFLKIVGDPANRPVLVHCHHGTGRSVLLSSVFRVEFENWDNETARRAVEPLHWRGNFAPGAPKGRYLLSYQPHRTRVLFDLEES